MSTEPARILVINPGSTSTKVALFHSRGRGVEDGGGRRVEDAREPSDSSVGGRSRSGLADSPSNGPGDRDENSHSSGGTASTPELIRGETIPADTIVASSALADLLPSRRAELGDFLDDIDHLDCIAARGGMVRPLAAGIYTVNDAMIDDLLSARYGDHPSNLGAPLAKAIGESFDCPAIIADPVGVDEFRPEARVSGLKGIERRSFSHALNLRFTARRAASDVDMPFEKARLIGVHLGGGISVAAIDGGRIVDVNNSNEGGPFTPQRTGSLPILQLVDLCFSGEYHDAAALKKKLTREGGLISHLGTDRVEEVIARADAGDAEAAGILDAMVYQIAKEIGAMAAGLSAKPEAIFITGGFARNSIIDRIFPFIDWMARVLVYPGEGEMEALAAAAVRFLSDEETAKTY